ncbi:hypothetical protein ACHOLT_00595 [Desulfitobacterium sp. Sab5]|uniref:hypothetical protein n=1 Tax=Desulfitobacterium nosdiversum TaxID=3375356 RepID=UPI003CE85165
MPLGKLNLFGNQQSPQGFTPMINRPGGYPMPPGVPPMNGGGLGGGIPYNNGRQGYPAPGYPPQGFLQQPMQNPMLPVRSYPPQGYPFQQNTPPIYNQGYGQMPVQPAWERPKKGGIKGFIGNLISKIKK